MILVFGGGGQLGRELVSLAAERGAVLQAIPRAETDIADRDAVRARVARSKPTMVVNAGAYTKVDMAELDRDAAYRSNAAGPAALAEACAQAEVPLVHISTDYVFDGSKAGPYVEDDPIAPLGVYGASKAEGEAAVREADARHVILRTSWVYGVHGANFLKTVLRLARERDELRIVADQRGCPTATADLAAAVLHIVPYLDAGKPVWGTYHVAGTGVTSWYEFASEIVEAQSAATGRHPPVIPITTAEYPTKAARPANSELDSSRFFSTFGFRAAPWRERTRQAVAALLGGRLENAK
jgi:dTDP-4-dehydrorhamnose reductase